MQYVKELITDPSEMIEVTVPESAAPATDRERQLLAQSAKPFETSEMYQPSSEKKFVDVNLRDSRFRSFDATQHPAMFRVMERVVGEANALDKENDLLLVKNDISHVKYTLGGFFKVSLLESGFNFINPSLCTLCTNTNIT